MLPLQNLVENLNQFKILVTAVNAAARQSIREMLREIGFSNILEAEDENEAIEMLKAESFDFIVCGFSLPPGNGLEFLRAVRGAARFQKLPFLMILDASDEIRADQLFKAGVDGYMVKPILSKTLEDKMAEIIFIKLPQSPLDAHVQKAGELIIKGDITRAHEQLDKAAEVNPRSPMVKYFRAKAFEAEGRIEDAKGAAAEAKHVFKGEIIGPREAARQVEDGKLFLDKGQIQEALEAFDRAVNFDPKNPKWNTSIGEALLARNMPNEAEKAFKASLKGNPNDISVYNRLGMAYRRQKKTPEAIANYKKALTIAPYEESLIYNLARAYLDAGDRSNAADSLKKALDLVPGFQKAAQLLEKITRI